LSLLSFVNRTERKSKHSLKSRAGKAAGVSLEFRGFESLGVVGNLVCNGVPVHGRKKLNKTVFQLKNSEVNQ
jgi:hypothetical protein